MILAASKAEDCGTFWRGAADLVIEITSPGDRTHEKLPFYSRLGVREVLIVNRQSWTLELYRHQAGGLEKAGQSAVDRPEVLTSGVLPLRFCLLPGKPRPQIEVTHVENGQRWIV